MGNSGTLVTAILASLVLAASGCGGGTQRLQHGWHHAEDGSVLWLAIEGKIEFLLATRQANVTKKVENWDGDEFNAYYEVYLGDDQRTTRILLYGDLGRGIVTGSFGTDVLDLEQGHFLKEEAGRPVSMDGPERERWLAQIRR